MEYKQFNTSYNNNKLKQINIKEIELIRQKDFNEAYKNITNTFDNKIIYNTNNITTQENIFNKTLQLRKELYKQNEELKQLMNEQNKKQNEIKFNNYMNQNIYNNENNMINDIDYYINNI